MSMEINERYSQYQTDYAEQLLLAKETKVSWINSIK